MMPRIGLSFWASARPLAAAKAIRLVALRAKVRLVRDMVQSFLSWNLRNDIPMI
jgi:hypothetical protein